MSKESEIEILTKRLVGQESISNPEDGVARQKEAAMADVIYGWFQERGVRSMLQKLPDGRRNVFAFVPGQSEKTVVLAGHFDTVGVKEFYEIPNVKAGDPFESDTVAEALGLDMENYVAGRGSFDMKSGIAVGMTLMDEWNKSPDPLKGSVLFVATCDEENDSYGILGAADILLELKGEGDGTPASTSLTGGKVLDLLGVVNMDYTTERYQGDPNYHVWSGTIGKTLPSILVRGQETHVGEHFGGFHASSLMSRIVSELEGNMHLADENVPPTVLRLSDGREFYNVMTANKLRAYFNVFSVGKTPTEILNEVNDLVNHAVGTYISSIQANYEIYKNRMFSAEERTKVKSADWRNTRVLTYSQLLKEAQERTGEKDLQRAIRDLTATTKGDGRDKSFAIVEDLLTRSGISEPAVVTFFSPPFYPYIKPDDGRLYEATVNSAEELGKEYGVGITMHHFYPYISDMSYLKLEPEIQSSLSGVTGEMPVWNLDDPQKPGNRIYSLDQEKISKVARLNLPVVNIGPYGFSAHKTHERVEKKYTFTILPELIKRVVYKMFE